MPADTPRPFTVYSAEVEKIHKDLESIQDVNDAESLRKRIESTEKRLSVFLEQMRKSMDNREITGLEYSQLSEGVRKLEFRLFILRHTGSNLDEDSMRFMYSQERYRPIGSSVTVVGNTITFRNVPTYRFNRNTNRDEIVTTNETAVDINLPANVRMDVVDGKFLVFRDTSGRGFRINPESSSGNIVIFLRSRRADGINLFNWSLNGTSSSGENLNALIQNLAREFRH